MALSIPVLMASECEEMSFAHADPQGAVTPVTVIKKDVGEDCISCHGDA